MLTRRQKRIAKKLYSCSERARADARAAEMCGLNDSLRLCDRFMPIDEGVVYYGFLDFEGDSPDDHSDEEISEFLEDQRVVINSPYDCTGQLFTNHIGWHRNPDGSVSYVHEMALDI